MLSNFQKDVMSRRFVRGANVAQIATELKTPQHLIEKAISVATTILFKDYAKK